MKKMKIKAVSMAVILAGSVIFVGCEKDTFHESDVPQASSSTVEESLFSPENATQGEEVYSDTLTMVSELFYRAGVSKLFIQLSENDSIITASNELMYDGSMVYLPNRIAHNPNIDLLALSIRISEGVYSIDGVSGLTLSIVNEKAYINSSGYTGFLEDNPALMENQNVLVLLLYANEMTLHEVPLATIDPGDEYNDEINGGGGCAFGDLNYIVGLGLTQAGSDANLAYSISQMQGDIAAGDCVAIGGIEHDTILFGLFDVSYQTYCCDGDAL